ncbi:MAG: hypothetical protein IPK19_15970 [Chloroflexi bacterium]|nr:hypothetical protein [Chloroflexota bacterium]
MSLLSRYRRIVPRRPFSSIRRLPPLAALLLVLSLSLFTGTPAEAACPASFPVTVPAGDIARLIEVIDCANATASNDVINLTNSTYTLTAVHSGGAGLPPIVTSATAGTLTINGNASVIQRSSAGGTPTFRLFTVNSGGNLTLNNMTLSNGSVPTAEGGAILNYGTVRLVASTVSGNTAQNGGGLHNYGGTMTVRDSLLWANTATANGGGITTVDGTLNVINSTLSGNSVTGTGATSGGGAIDAYGITGPLIRLYSSTVAYNTAGVAARSGFWREAGTAYIVNTILANNNGANNCAYTGGTGVLVTSIDNGTSCGFPGTYGTNTNPMLQGLANNGGPTLTHALLAGSPAIGYGTNSWVHDEAGVPLTADQRGAGYPRTIGTTADIGAYESLCGQAPTFSVPAGDTARLIEAINCANAAPSNDVINLTDSTYTLTAVYANGTGLPAIVTEATAGSLTINGSGATIQRSSAGGTPHFRLFTVNSGADLTLNSLTLTGGLSDLSGGAIYNDGELRLASSTVDGNTAVSGGGFYNNSNGLARLRDSTLSNNTATTYGGGVANYNAYLYVLNSTISGNSALGTSSSGGGGAIDSWGASDVFFRNSTITNNTAAAPNAARSGYWQEAGWSGIANTIISGNNGANNCKFDGGTQIGEKNIENGLTCGFDLSGDPLLGPLADNGGPTLTHALHAVSPAINAGSNADALDEDFVVLANDQRGAGYPRIIAGTVDLGAYESYCGLAPTFTIAAGDTAGLIEAINCANGSPSDNVINLTAGAAYTLTAAYASSTGLPPIVTAATAGTLTINGDGATIERSSAGGTPDFRLFTVNSGANLILNLVTLRNGRVLGGSGGAITNDGGNLTLTASTLDSNTAGSAGGLYNHSASVTTLRDSTLSNNTATSYGGGIASSSATLNVINSTISGNDIVSAGDSSGGGALDAYGAASTVLVVNSTITDNTAPQAARSGIWLEAGTLTIQNSIVAGNNGTTNCLISGGVLVDNGGNIDGGISCGFGTGAGSFWNTDPLLGPLADNGGPTQTHLPAATSPAINAGTNARAVDQNGAALTSDQRGTGYARIISDVVDSGAVEAACPAFPFTVPGGSANLLTHAIACANSTPADDVINLVNSTYTLTRVHADDTGLPNIVMSQTAGALTINGYSATIARSSAPGTPHFRLLTVSRFADLILNDLTLTNGSANPDHPEYPTGGAILNFGVLSLNGVTIHANSAVLGGGLSNHNVVYAITSTFSNNTASDSGGAILNQPAGSLFLINSTLSGNTANGSTTYSGGGALAAVNVYGGSVRIVNSTITNNTAVQTARSGIFNIEGVLTIQNSIVAGNNGANNCSAEAGATITDNGYNLDNGTSCGFDGPVGQNTAPLLGPLSSNGGPTLTHALLANSPAINAGSNNLAIDPDDFLLSTDQRGDGYPRIVGDVVDIGAFEAACPAFPYTVPAGNPTLLIYAIACANSTPANDVINLTNSTYTLTADLTDGTGLPPIVTTTTAGSLTINGSGATIQRSSAPGTPEFRFILVDTDGDLTLNDLTLTNGSASGSGTEGGAAIRSYGALRLSSVTIHGNTAAGGGGVYNQAGALTIVNSTFSNNTASDYGGAILNFSGILRLINSTLSGNAANGSSTNGGGGALDSYDALSVVTIINSTITNNTAMQTARSGIWLETGTLTLQNSIVAGNNGANNCLVEAGATITDNGNNLDNGTSCGFGASSLSNTNPLLGALANNGGPTQTHLPANTSPAINAGSNAKAVDENGAALTTDQRGAGYPRTNAGSVDIGAVEAFCPGTPYTVPAGSANLLIYAIACANSSATNDVINLTNSTYTLTAVNASDTGLPPILFASAGTLTINGNGATIARSSAPGTPNFRLFYVNIDVNLTLNDLTLTNGSANVGSVFGRFGGAIFNRGVLRLSGVTIHANSADEGGGGVINSNNGTLTIVNSTFSNNTASGYGGAIFNNIGIVRLVNSTLSGNAANGSTTASGGGGALDTFGASSVVTIINSTITNNTAVQTARSGIWLEGGTLTIQNSIVAGNNGANNCVKSAGTFTDNGNNLDNGTSCGFGGAVGQNTNPLLGPLANNGGPTFTHLPAANSPAINAGSNAKAVDENGAALTTDQRGAGFPRINSGTVDIGAVEVILPAGNTLQTTLTLQGRTNPTPHASYIVTVHVRVMPQGAGRPSSVRTMSPTPAACSPSATCRSAPTSSRSRGRTRWRARW